MAGKRDVGEQQRKARRCHFRKKVWLTKLVGEKPPAHHGGGVRGGKRAGGPNNEPAHRLDGYSAVAFLQDI